MENVAPTGIFFLIVLVLFALFVRSSCSLCSIDHSRPIVLRAVDFSIPKNPTASVGANPRSWVPEASTQTPTPPKPLDPRIVLPVASLYTD
jgi:hypothetical protein